MSVPQKNDTLDFSFYSDNTVYERIGEDLESAVPSAQDSEDEPYKEDLKHTDRLSINCIISEGSLLIYLSDYLYRWAESIVQSDRLDDITDFLTMKK